MPGNNSDRRKFLVSACLTGEKCRWDGTSSLIKEFRALREKGLAVPFCPEVEGGISVPHSRCEIIGGGGADVIDGKARVVMEAGVEVTAQFLKGARRALVLCEQLGLREAVLKSRSPSCATFCIYDGTFSGKLKKGKGVTAAFLEAHGIMVRDETGNRTNS